MSDDLDTFDPVRGSARERIDADELADADVRAAVVLDRRRRRALYSVDRFLTARDLTRGQQYTLLRQADLAQLSGGGVVHGLEVATDATGRRLTIAPGMGVARSGESIALRDPVTMVVARLRVLEGRSIATALVAEGGASRPVTGLFMLVARPVEHARNPTATFPTGIASQIQLADTELVEGTWFTLTPLPSAGQKDAVARGRARLAREVFVGGFDPTLLTDGLPLAIAGIVDGRVQWIDADMATRDVGADAVVSFGLQTRKTRLAYQAQYGRHLDEEVARRRNAGLPDGLPAIEAFDALPPVGPLPRGAVVVTPTEVRQSFFPREIYVELAIMPQDELASLLTEGLVRAPIDLQAGAAALEGVPVLVVVPVPRAGFDEQVQKMEGSQHAPATAGTGRPLVDARPIDALTVLRVKNEPPTSADPAPLDLEAWRKAIESAGELWYVRRPQHSIVSAVVPREAEISEDDAPLFLISDAARAGIRAAGEARRFNHLFGGVAPTVLQGADALFGEGLSGSQRDNLRVASMIGELAFMARRPPLPEKTDPVVVMRSPLFDAPASSGGPLRRELQLGDVERVRARFTAGNVAKFLDGRRFAAPGMFGIMATSAVVPELALWVAAGGRDAHESIEKLAKSADIAGLRAVVHDVVLPKA